MSSYRHYQRYEPSAERLATIWLPIDSGGFKTIVEVLFKPVEDRPGDNLPGVLYGFASFRGGKGDMSWYNHADACTILVQERWLPVGVTTSQLKVERKVMRMAGHTVLEQVDGMLLPRHEGCSVVAALKGEQPWRSFTYDALVEVLLQG
ncbi:hypothetical protein LTR78_009348, partial [Recurvomyces mirabilis]